MSQLNIMSKTAETIDRISKILKLSFKFSKILKLIDLILSKC
jgi:hypothetical protein